MRTRLDAAYEEGQLGADEYHDRSDRAAAAKTLGELQRLVGDLQETNAVPLVSEAAVARRATGKRYPVGTRAGTADRAAACALLDAGLADGQLTAADHRALTELAGEARTLVELAELTDDLQRSAGAPADPRPPRSYRGQLFAVALVVVTVAAVVGGFTLTHRDAEAAKVAAAAVADLGVITPKVVPLPQLFTTEGLTLFREQYRAKFGDTLVDDLNLYPTWASITRVPQPNRSVRFDYRGGFQQSGAVESRRSGSGTVDLAMLDIPAIMRLAADAPKLLQVDQGAISLIEYQFGDGVPVVSIFVSNEFKESGHLTATPAGAVIRAYPFRR